CSCKLLAHLHGTAALTPALHLFLFFRKLLRHCFVGEGLPLPVDLAPRSPLQERLRLVQSEVQLFQAQRNCVSRTRMPAFLGVHLNRRYARAPIATRSRPNEDRVLPCHAVLT